MQIALDTVVYILLSLMLFSLVLAFLPKVEELGYTFSREETKLTKEEAINEIISIYIGTEKPKTILLKEEITRDELESELDNAGVDVAEFDFNFNSSSTLSIMKSEGRVIING